MTQVYCESTIEEICNVEYGTRVVRKKDAGTIYPVYGGGGETFFLDTFNRENRVVVARFAMSERCTRRVLGKFALNDSGLTLSPKDASILRQDYLDYFVLSINEQIYESARGTAQKNLDVPAFRNMKVVYPRSLKKQQEIVKKLDSAFSEIERIRLNIFEQIDASLSLLSHAIRNLINDPKLKCRNTTLDNICENLDNKRIPITRDVRASGEFPYYGASGIIDYVKNYIFEGDALLVSEDGANLLARSTPIAFSVSGKYWVNNHAHILKFVDQDLQKYVEYLLENTKLDDFITGAAQPKLTQRALNTIPIRIPVQESEIKQVVAVISSLKELSLSASENLQLRLKLTDELQASLLGKYFKPGEAVA